MKSLKYKKKICIVTSSRAEFGILKSIIKNLKKSSKIRLELILTGAHFMSKFGNTYKEIADSGIKSFSKIITSQKNNNSNDISFSSSNLLKKISEIFFSKRYDLIILLGDRYETLIAAYAATLNKIPIAHLFGGDETVGAYDNQFRHSISKFSHVHFVTNEISKKRLIRMGEDPSNIFNFGNPSLDNIYSKNKISKKKKENKLRIKFRLKNFIVTYHPETLSSTQDKKLKIIFKSLSSFNNCSFFFTSSGNDEGADLINKMIKNYVKSRSNMYFFKSLGQTNYFSLMKHVDGVIGNSSSGIYEVPSFKKGTVNIGDRQKGRLISKSVINCDYEEKKIINNIKKITSNKFKISIKKMKNLYYKKNSSSNITKTLLKFCTKSVNLKKKFHD